jgi:single-strand DNA-binding protein
MINMAMLLGRVGNKDTKTLRNGNEVTILSVATSKKFKDATGQVQEQTTWHNVNCFSKLCEIANKYVHVGDLVFVQGDIQNKKIEAGDRAGQYVYSIHANAIKFIPKGNKSESENKSTQASSQGGLPFEDDGIPFF